MLYTFKVNKYEPEEWQQLVAENNFQKVFNGDNGALGLFCLWCLRDFSDNKYKGPVGVNTKGLLTYAGSKKDIYYLVSSNTQNPAYFMDTPVQEQWTIYYDLDSTADNSWNTLPEEFHGAAWIALHRVTKPKEATNLSFTVTMPSKIYVMATRTATPPAFAADGKFTEVFGAASAWRDNAMLLVASQLFVHDAQPGEEMRLTLGDRDAVVLVK